MRVGVGTRRVAWVLLFAAGCVLGTALLAAVHLRASARARSNGALRFATVELEALELDRAVDAAWLSTASSSSTASLTEVESLRQAFEAAYSDSLEHLHGTDHARLEAAGPPFVRAVDGTVRLMEAGDVRSAASLESSTADTAFQTLHPLLEGFMERSRAQADGQRAIADAGFVAILILTGSSIAVLAGAAGMAHRRADLLAAEAEAGAAATLDFGPSRPTATTSPL